ncbi:thioredoxin domain-containing protein [Haladaptatus sp. W1]|uniref:DsbA family protein n=1 Tax=Haladaptatus sp. W1 TaxID=1897478 RepID=UPI0020C80E26|nr:thioredoxin domain-containing protein [Haladaptatus sp. W1]
MTGNERRMRRRAFLGSAAVAAGLAGCASGQTDSNDTTGTTKSTSSDGGDSGTGGGTNGDTSDSLVFGSEETTAYGIDLAGNPILGAPDADVDIYYWSDYQCPFCSRFEQDTFPKLVENYLRPGKVRFVVLELPNIGSASTTASRMAKCVWRQVRDDSPAAFKRWHSTMFDEQGKPNSGWASKENLLDITRTVDGVDAKAVESCLGENGASLQSSIDDDVNAATRSDVSATPGFIFFDRESEKAGKIMGAQPYPRFESAIRKIRDA